MKFPPQADISGWKRPSATDASANQPRIGRRPRPWAPRPPGGGSPWRM